MLAFVFLLCLSLLARADTEVIQFDLASPPTPNSKLKVPKRNTHVIRPSGKPLELSVPIISSSESDGAKWSLRCDDDQGLDCLFDSWTVVNFEEDGFEKGLIWPGRFMARVSWPASHPVRIDLSVHMLEPMSDQHSSHATDENIVGAFQQAILIRVTNQGVFLPQMTSTNNSSTNTSRPQHVPLLLTVEPLLLGAIPPSTVPTVVAIFLLIIPLAVTFTSLVLQPWLLSHVVDNAKKSE
ncbi:hypothetical protein FRB95_005583 [Tulasnella sp. JGI-2019a]|nr:hypothetical protein FRB95_005583 [Tulasnella sp. JGI-2019a]